MARVGINYVVCAPRHKSVLPIMLDAKNYAGIIDADLICAYHTPFFSSFSC